jgi:putative DNA primase/helicase
VTLHDAALTYAARGWPVLPLHTPTANAGCSCRRDCSHPGKHPRVRSGKDHAAGSTDPRQITKWWRKWPDANVGIVTGAPSGLVVLDCDPRNGGDESLKAWRLAHGDLPVTPTSQTGGGGSHRFLAHPGGEIRIKNIAPGLDIKADGGIIVAPPSLHASGSRYQWEASLSPIDVDPAAVPEGLASLLRPPVRTAAAPSHVALLNGNEAPLRRYAEGAARRSYAAVTEAPVGWRNNALNKAAFDLGRFSKLALLDRAAVEESLRSAASSAGLPPVEAEATIRSGLDAGEAKPHDVAALQARVGRQRSSGHVVELREDATIRPLTDTGNAERLVLHHGRDLRYCHPWKKWLCWDGRRWSIDNRGRLMRLSKDVVRRIYAEAARVDDLEQRKAITDWAQKSERLERRRAMVELAASEDGIWILPEQLNPEAWFLNLRNGTLDLRSGEMHTHRREDMITKVVPTDFVPGTACTMWEKFLARVVPDEQVRAFLRRAVGWTLTGDQSGQCLFFCYGLGANGKSTFLLVLLNLLGKDYAIQATHDLLLSKRDRSHPTERADLFGIRLAVCTELGAGRSFDEVLLKQLTGNDRIRARRMREDPWEFDPTHHLWISANHRPIIRGTDEAIWRRMTIIPFTVRIPKEERDKKLITKLLKELQGILVWALGGWLECQQRGLDPPAAVLAATQNYRVEMDVLADFFEARCVLTPDARVQATALYASYEQWCSAAGERAESQREFGRTMSEREFQRLKIHGRKWYVGIGLRAFNDDESEQRGDDGGPSGPTSDIDGLEPPREQGNAGSRSSSSPRSPTPSEDDAGGAAEDGRAP